MEQKGKRKKLLSLILMWTLVIGLMLGMSVTVPVIAEEPVSITEEDPEEAANLTDTPSPDTLTDDEEKEEVFQTESVETQDTEGSVENDQEPVPSTEAAVEGNTQQDNNSEAANNEETEVKSVAEQVTEENSEREREETDPVQPEQTEEPVTVEYPAFEDSKTVDGVTVTVSADKDTFPEGTILSVEKVEAVKKVEEAVEEERSEDVKVAASYTFDIKIFDKDGNEIQPAEGKTVNVSFKLAEVADQNLSTEVYHLTEEGNNNYAAESLDVSEQGTEATVETTGFSYYTVEFTYDNLQYVLNGDESIPLSTILNTVGLTGEVTAAEVSDTDLFTVSNNDGEWIVTALQAFSTAEWMKVTINSMIYEIVVTDDIHSYNLWVGGVLVTSEKLTGDNWYFVPDTNTLTLDGVNITDGYKNSRDEKYGIFYVGNNALNIELKGSNQIGSEQPSLTYGIYSESNDAAIKICGSGNLTVYSSYDGITSKGFLTITDEINVKVTSIGEASCNGIYLYNADLLIKTATVTTTGAYGIFAYHGGVTIDDATVTAIGKDFNAIYIAGESPNKENLTITGGKIIASSFGRNVPAICLLSGDVTISDNADVTASGSGSGISSANGNVQIANSIVTATGRGNIGISSANGNVQIANSIVTATGETIGISSADGNVEINKSTVTASGNSYVGILAKEITIGEDVTKVIAAGSEFAFAGYDNNYDYIPGTVKNAVAGKGWTNPEGTGKQAEIVISTEGQTLGYKKVQFPGVLAPAKVTTAPAAKDLTENGSAQELVTAGTAEGGTMQYALGTAAEATGSYSTSIPTGTEAGTYYVWYKAVGDDNHSDSTPVCVTVTIAAPETNDYYVSSGDGQTWQKGSSSGIEIVFKNHTNDRETFSRWTRWAAADGKRLADSDFTAKEGSLIINLKPEYLETLSVGEHKLTIAFDNSSQEVSATFTVKEKSSSGRSSAPEKKTDNVVTCQMAGYPANYAWNETAKACQPGYLDANGVFHSTAVRLAVPNTYDEGMAGREAAFILSTIFAIGAVYMLRKFK